MIEITSTGILSFIAFAAAFAAVLLLPGFLISRVLFNGCKVDSIARIPLSLSLSVCFFSTLGLFLYVFHAGVSSIIPLLAVFILLLIAANVVLRKRHGRTRLEGEISRPKPVRDRRSRANAVLFALMLVAFFLMLYRGAMFDWGADSMDHVGTVRDIVEKRQLFPTNAFYAGDDGLGPDPRKGLYHASLAVISIVTGIEPYRIWIWLPALLLPILLCSYFVFTSELFENKNTALISAICFLLFFEGANRTVLGAAGYPSRVAIQMYLTALFLMFKFLRTENPRFLLGGAFLGYAIATVHIYYYFQFCLALGAFFIFSFLLRRADKRTLFNIVKLGAATVVLSIPYLILQYKLSYAVENPNHSNIRHMLYFSDTVFAVNPTEPLDIIGPMGVFAFVLTPFLYKYARKHAGILFLFANMIITPLIIFNPPVVVTLGKLITNGLVRRIIRLAPYIAVVGFFTNEMIRAFLRGRGWRIRAKSLLFFALFLAASVPYFSQFYEDYRPAAKELERNQSAFKWFDALEFLEGKVDTPKVILSDPWTSYSIPAFTKHYIVAVPVGHASPKDANNVARIRDAMNVLNPYVDMKNTMSILDKYNVDYVVINQTFDSRVDRHGWAINPLLYEGTRRKFESFPGIFRSVYHETNLQIYEYRRPADVAGLETGRVLEVPYLTADAPKLRNVVNAIYEDQFMLLGAVADRDTVSRGDTLGIKCYWKNLKETVPPKYYKVFVRFDTEYEKGALYRPYWSKIYRRAKQLVAHERFRFRADHNPVNGVYPPNDWRPGETVVDEFEVMIPSDVAAGSYEVKVTLLEMPYGPNLYWSDLFMDNDIYDGVKVGSIVVRR